MKKAAAGIPFYRLYSCDSFSYAIFTALSRSFSSLFSSFYALSGSSPFFIFALSAALLFPTVSLLFPAASLIFRGLPILCI